MSRILLKMLSVFLPALLLATGLGAAYFFADRETRSA